MKGIECNNCGERVIPRLWFYESSFLGGGGYLRAQHICCYCGVCMYETGGGLNSLGKLCVGVILAVGAFFVGVALLGVRGPTAKQSDDMMKIYSNPRALTAVTPVKPAKKASTKVASGDKAQPLASISR
jgi:hypothetical protein